MVIAIKAEQSQRKVQTSKQTCISMLTVELINNQELIAMAISWENIIHIQFVCEQWASYESGRRFIQAKFYRTLPWKAHNVLAVQGVVYWWVSGEDER